MSNKQEIYDLHSELFHYTSRAGVKGILESQALWATHYRFLNDPTEFQLAKEIFQKEIYEVARKHLIMNKRNMAFSGRREIDSDGGVINIAKVFSKNVTSAFRSTAFGSGLETSKSAEPFVTSFCTHSKDQKYVRENGLLSQWRGYGGNNSKGGGFAIVLDTKKLSDLYKFDNENYYDMSSFLGDVVYDGNFEKFKEEFSEAFHKIPQFIQNFLENDEWDIESIFLDAIQMFARFKHRAFSEEREVRFVVNPFNNIVEAACKAASADYVRPNKKMREVYCRNRGHDEEKIPYIKMLGYGGKKSLPIKRIIIGPQRDQDEAESFLKKLIGNKNIKIIRSQTPFSY